MRYIGSKRLLAKYLLPIILKDRKPDQWYVEPFVGGCNMIENVSPPYIGNDINQYLIAFLKALQKGYIPPIKVDRELYYNIKYNMNMFPKELVGYVGFYCSYRGKFFWRFCGR